MINELVQDYLNHSPYELNTVNGSKGLCDLVATDLKKIFKQNNIESTVIEGIGLIPTLHESAHEDWQIFKGRDQKFLAHVVLKVNDQIIDLTGTQFNENNANRNIYSFSQFKKEWKTIKTPKHLNN